MSLQSQVYTSCATGIPGSRADANSFDHYPLSLLAESALPAGCFVWLGSDPQLYAINQGADQPIGLVEHQLSNALYPNEDPTLIPADEAISIATHGAFHVISSTEATPGQAVFANLEDGSIATASSASTLDNYIETKWSVITAAPAGQSIIIKRSR